MNFFERVTGSDITKAMYDFDTRIQTLPANYQDAWQEIVTYLMPYGDFSGRNLIMIFNNLIELLEISSVNEQKIEDIFGDDLKSFCAEIASSEGIKNYRDKWHTQLNANVKKKLGDLK